jgi:hypothetical protein
LKRLKQTKLALIKNYVLIGAVFAITVVLNTFFIRTLYMSIHVEEVTKEAKGVVEYAKVRFINYDSFDWLVDFWTQNGLNSGRT